MSKYLYVPMPINADGNGPADADETVKVIHQVWDEENIALCSCDYKEIAQSIAASLNREESDALVIRSLIAALHECEDYFDNRADADCDQDGFIPNKEMTLLSEVREAIAKATAA